MSASQPVPEMTSMLDEDGDIVYDTVLHSWGNRLHPARFIGNRLHPAGLIDKKASYFTIWDLNVISWGINVISWEINVICRGLNVISWELNVISWELNTVSWEVIAGL